MDAVGLQLQINLKCVRYRIMDVFMSDYNSVFNHPPSKLFSSSGERVAEITG